jgi:hypothetical protein
MSSGRMTAPRIRPFRAPLLRDFFALHPDLLDYFTQFGCANIFHGHIPDACVTRASALFIELINRFGITDPLARGLVVNFTFHAFPFLAALRERLTERGRRQGDQAQHPRVPRGVRQCLAGCFRAVGGGRPPSFFGRFHCSAADGLGNSGGRNRCRRNSRRVFPPRTRAPDACR